jgi:peptide/nickel transport system ATP-binding protein
MVDELAARGVCVRAAQRTLLQGADLVVPAGRLTGCIGASGAGKSLLSRALLGRTSATPGFTAGTLSWGVAGEVRTATLSGPGLPAPWPALHGEVVASLPQHAAHALDPMLPVARLVGDVAGRWRQDADPRPWLVAAALEPSEALLRRRPHELSGGMASRVAIAQVLARGSRYVIADEPFANLDPLAAAEVAAALRALVARGIGVLLITHDLRHLDGARDDLVILDLGEVVETRTAGWSWAELRSPAGQRLATAVVAR